MKAYRKLFIIVIAVFILTSVLLNLFLMHKKEVAQGEYRVEAARLTRDIESTGDADLSKYKHLTGIFTEEDGDLYSSEEHYLIIEAAGKTYRVEYLIENDDHTLITMNVILVTVFILVVLLMLYIRKHIVIPFDRLNDVPSELAKGNLAVPIPEEKSRFFGKFTWGIEMLRNNIESGRKKELSLQKERKLLLLSLSHDILTPLSAIKLNSKALSKGLYTDEDKRREVAESINCRADEIEQYIREITKASTEDFMTFEVNMGEEYLDNIIGRITARYAVQLETYGTSFVVGDHDNPILSCDPDRLCECIQNLIENAMKYGDGKKIGIDFEVTDGFELITVSDTGCTLPSSELPQIFDSFHRGTNASNKPGNGLGLFICKRLMNMMGGEAYADIKDGEFRVTLVVKIA